MGIHKLNFLLNFDCVIIHRNIDVGIAYFLEKVLNFDFMAATRHSFRLNIIRVITFNRYGYCFSLSGVAGLDFVICLWWHGQVFYWGSLFVSICNLVLVAFERFELQLVH